MEQTMEKIIVRNLSGEASCEDIVKLSEWLVEKDANKQAFFQLKAYWDAELRLVSIRNKEAACEQLLRRIRKSSHRTIHLQWLRYVGVAIIAAVMAGVIAYHQGTKQPPATPVTYYSCISGNAFSPVYLPDGTEIMLNKHSRLTYSNRYGEDTREVSLEGEAFFDVRKDTARTFVVCVGENRIRALGTTFNVRHYPEENTLNATLVEGVIRFETPQQTVLLKPEQQLLYNTQSHKASIRQVDVEVETAWKNNLLRYKSVLFTEFLRLLEKRYDVEILLQDRKLGQQKVSGAFDVDLSVEQILDMTRKSLPFHWKKEGDKYIIVNR
jgi:ferric-dicitrate binding protein FerR (iron transport regulator)